MFAAPVPQNTPLDKDQTNTPPPSSGPFVITNVDAPKQLVMERNPQFKTVQDAGASDVAGRARRQDHGHPEQEQLRPGDRRSSRTTIDFMVDPPIADRLPEVENQYSDRFRFEDSINTYYFWMNNQEPPFDDLQVRQAVNYAIDPEALNRIFGGRLHPDQQILPPGMPGYEEYELYPGPDLEQGDSSCSTQANPSDRDITVWTDDEPDRKRIGAYYQDVLNQLGFNATLKIIAGDVYFTTIGNAEDPGSGHRDSRTGSRTTRTRTTSSSRCCTGRVDPAHQQQQLLRASSIPELTRRSTSSCSSSSPTKESRTQYAALDKNVHGAGGVGAVRKRASSRRSSSERIDFDTVFTTCCSTRTTPASRSRSKRTRDSETRSLWEGPRGPSGASLIPMEP